MWNFKTIVGGLIFGYVIMGVADYIAVKNQYSVKGCQTLGEAVRQYPSMVILAPGWIVACGKDLETK